MKCPRHYSIELERLTLEGIEVDRCPHCAGIWLEAGTLKRVLGAMPRTSLDPFEAPVCAEDGAPMRCSRCGAATVLVSGLPVQINVCAACRGIWLDAHELGKLKACDDAGQLVRLWSAV